MSPSTHTHTHIHTKNGEKRENVLVRNVHGKKEPVINTL